MVKKNSDALPAGYELNGSQYKIKQLLGDGGFGLTYLAHDSKFERDVAIKEFFPSSYARRIDDEVALKNEEYQQQFNASLQAFEGEGKALAKCDHRGVVEVFDRFEEHGTAYLVMQLVQGVCLDDWIKQKDGDFTSLILPGLLDALEHIHNKKLVHRDLKPANIMIREADGQPVLIDFGATRIDFDRNAKTTMITTTEAYAAPELFADADLGHATPASDLYALGAMLYEYVTGELPMRASFRTINDQLKSVSEKKADEFTHQTGLLKAIDAALVMSPKQRMQNISAFRALLKEDQTLDKPLSSNSILNEESPAHSANNTSGKSEVPATVVMEKTSGDQSDPANEKHTTSKNTTHSDVRNGSRPSAMLSSIKRHRWLAFFCVSGSFVFFLYVVAYILAFFGNTLGSALIVGCVSALLASLLASIYESYWSDPDNIRDDIALFIGMGMVLFLSAGVPQLFSKDYEQELCRDFYDRSYLNPFGLHIVSDSCQVEPEDLYKLFKSVTPAIPLDLQTASGASTFYPGDEIAINMRGFGKEEEEIISVLVDAIFHEGDVLMVKHYKSSLNDKLFRHPDGMFNNLYNDGDKSCKANHTFCLTAEESYDTWTFLVAATKDQSKWPDNMFITEGGGNQESLNRYYSRLLKMKYAGKLPLSSMDEIEITVAPKHSVAILN